jgi:hypothetical protein
MFVAPLVALVLALTLSQTLRAADAPAASTGTVSVTVNGPDGKPVEGATVRVTQHMGKSAKSGDSADSKTDTKLADSSSTAKPAAVAEGKTDKDGKVKLEDIAAGDYNLSANLKGTGSARQKITVKAGDNLDVELKLAPKASK